MAVFFDTHAHLDFPDFAEDLLAVVERARAAGIERILSVGTDLEASRRAVALSERYPEIYAVVGWHPGHAEEAPEDIREDLRQLVAHPKVVAVGECGLDFFRLPSRVGTGTVEDDARIRARQARVFAQQLEVAAEVGLNIVIHTRDSFAETLEQFEPYADRVRAVFHCFVSSPTELQRVLALGSLVSFTGIATFKNGANVRETLAVTPIDRFLLETDCPFLAPVPYRGKRCEPAYIRELAQFIAEQKGCTLEELSQITCATARSFFHKLG